MTSCLCLAFQGPIRSLVRRRDVAREVSRTRTDIPTTASCYTTITTQSTTTARIMLQKPKRGNGNCFAFMERRNQSRRMFPLLTRTVHSSSADSWIPPTNNKKTTMKTWINSNKLRKTNKVRKSHKERAAMAEKCLYITSVLPRGQVNVDTWNFLLAAIETYATSEQQQQQQPHDDQQQQHYQNVQQADRLLQRCIQEIVFRLQKKTQRETMVDDDDDNDDDSSSALPWVLTATPIIQVLQAWASTCQPEALNHCQKLFEQMDKLHQEYPAYFANPHQKHVYSALLDVCIHSRHPDARRIADDWMELFAKEFPHACIPTELYNQIILVHASRAATEYGAAAAAEDWLVHLSDLHARGETISDQAVPSLTTATFNGVLRAWTNSPENSALERAQVILNLMLNLQQDHPAVRPNVETFAIVLRGCAHRRQAQQADTLWRETLQYFSGDQISTSRQIVDLSTCLNATTLAWSRSDSPEADQRIDAILKECKLLQQQNTVVRVESTTGAETKTPLTTGIAFQYMGKSINNLLTALVKQDKVLQADERLRQFWQAHITSKQSAPLAGSLEFVIRSYKQQENLVDRAQRATKLLLDGVELKRMHQSLQRPEDASFSLCLEMCLEEYPSTKSLVMDILHAAESMRRVTFEMYQLVINALRQEATDESAMQAYRVLQRLTERDRDPRSWVEVKEKDVGVYTAVLKALAEASTLETADACLDLFRYIQDSSRWRLSRNMYNAAIFNLRKKGKVGRQRALELFREIVEAEKDPSNTIQLHSFVFETVLRVLHSHDDVTSAKASLEVLLTMLEMCEKGRKELAPNQVCLDVCLSTVAQSGSSEMSKLGSQLLSELERRNHIGTLACLPSDGVIQRLRHKTN